MARRLVLISTSTVFGTRYLEHAHPELRDAFGGVSRVLFIPHAIQARDGYVAKARPAFEEMGYGLDSLHEAFDPRRAIENAEAIFCGGGNTFRLLKTLDEMGVLPSIRRRVAEGMVYSGASAGSNLAGPTIRTTNDMPIVQPPSFESFDLIPFQINPHYVDPDPGSTHMGETRAKRIQEFLEENDVPGLGMREGSWLRRRDRQLILQGTTGARLFRRGMAEEEDAPGSELSCLLPQAGRFDVGSLA
jgi:dipeptidase E